MVAMTAEFAGNILLKQQEITAIELSSANDFVGRIEYRNSAVAGLSPSLLKPGYSRKHI